VHEIRDWDDLRRRIDPVDRRCYGFPDVLDARFVRSVGVAASTWSASTISRRHDVYL